MLKNISNLGSILNNSEQKSISGGKKAFSDSFTDTDCVAHYHFCDEAHPTDHSGFSQCMESCGC